MRTSAALALCLIFAACGPHRIIYVRSSIAEGTATYMQQRTHSHGFGPLLVGGGAYFGVLNEMSPALIDYTGAVDLPTACPYGFTKVTHGHNFGQSVMAGAISWLIVFNAYHPSDVEITCLHPATAPAPGGAATP